MAGWGALAGVVAGSFVGFATRPLARANVKVPWTGVTRTGWGETQLVGPMVFNTFKLLYTFEPLPL